MTSVLDKHRIGIAALAIGIAQAALHAAVCFAGTRPRVGQAIAEFESPQRLLALWPRTPPRPGC